MKKASIRIVKPFDSMREFNDTVERAIRLHGPAKLTFNVPEKLWDRLMDVLQFRPDWRTTCVLISSLYGVVTLQKV